jgi:hypothetical protein
MYVSFHILEMIRNVRDVRVLHSPEIYSNNNGNIMNTIGAKRLVV